VAETVALPIKAPVTSKVACVCPAATVTLAGTVTLAETAPSDTSVPVPDAAVSNAAVSVTVPPAGIVISAGVGLILGQVIAMV